MPWHIAQNVGDCKGFAVVKDDSGEIVGCHASRPAALDQLAALYASEQSTRASSFTPTKEMRDEAARGLAWRREHGRGGTSVGIARARDLVNGKDLPLDTVKRMRSFFARHEVDKQGEGFSPGEPGYPSNGRIAWALWGGDPGYRWSLAIVKEADEENNRSKPLEIQPEIGRLVLAETRRVNGREVEYRTVTMGQFIIEDEEYEEDEEDDVEDDAMPMRFRGYAAVFNMPSEPLPFVESIAPGAFKRSLASGREVRMFLNHNTDQVLGSTRSGTLVLKEDERGLWVENDLPPTSVGRDLSILMQRGDVHSMSFGFSIPRGGDSWSEDGQSRELREVILHEVSVVTGFPAYPATTGASVRNVDDEPSTDQEPEAITERVGKSVDLARRYLTLAAKR
jgi:HK97 family phage prohead protease